MKAAICTKYGSPEVIEIQELATPLPKDDEILVKILATSVNSADSRIRSLNVPRGFRMIMPLIMGFTKPRNAILGTELAGIVEAVGKNITAFDVGDKVIADCGIKMGAHAQFRLFKESDVITHAPKNIDILEAGAMIFGASTAFYFLKTHALLQPKETLLINGASGAVGLAAIQIAHHIGAEITAVCSGKHIDLVKSLGATHVIDYTQTPIANLTQQYDVVMDNVGNITWHDAALLNKNGRLLKVVASLYEIVSAPLLSLLTDKSYIVRTAFADKPMLNQLNQLVDDGHLKPIISKRFSLTNIQDAYRLADSGHKTGSILILCHEDVS